MFGTDMLPVTFIIVLAEFCVLFHVCMYLLVKKKDTSTLRFIFLNISFLFYNIISGLFPDEEIPINYSLQIFAAYYIGLQLSTAFVSHIYYDYSLNPIKIFKPKFMFGWLLVLFLIVFVPIYLIAENLILAKSIFMGVIVVMAFLFFTSMVWKLEVKKRTDEYLKNYYRKRISFLTLSIGFYLILPLIVFVGDYQIIEQPLVNMSFVFLTINYITKNILLQRIEKEAYQHQIFGVNSRVENGIPDVFTNIEKYKLTSAEFDITLLMLSGKNFKEIASILSITAGTVRKHASNIYSKANVKSKKEYITKIT